MAKAPIAWNPTAIRYEIRKYDGNSLAVQVGTDAGDGYLKALNAKHCPHDLACELVGTLLAERLGLPTFDYAVVDVPDDPPFELHGGVKVVAGPGFITRSLSGMKWSGRPSELETLVNPQDLGRLVAFDTWTLNCDRYRPRTPDKPCLSNPGNVYLAREGAPPGQHRLTAMDHANCFKCNSDLSPGLLRRVASDDTLFGYFPGFGRLAKKQDALDAVGEIESVQRGEIQHFVAQIPMAWLREDAARMALTELICLRSRSLRRTIQREFPIGDLFDEPGVGEDGRD